MYGLEYSTALLMNLCLHKAGKTQCVPIASNVLEILVKLVVRDLKQVFYPIPKPALDVLLCFSLDKPLCQWCIVQFTGEPGDQ